MVVESRGGLLLPLPHGFAMEASLYLRRIGVLRCVIYNRIVGESNCVARRVVDMQELPTQFVGVACAIFHL